MTPAAGMSAIASFFDDVSGKRNRIFTAHPVLAYEQYVRSRAVLESLAATAGETVLDVGCGNARDMLPILQAGAGIVGVDLSAGMIQQARLELAAAGYPDVELEIGDATRLRFAAESFDKILCSEVIEHIPNTDDAISEMYRVLKPGGRLIVSTPNRRSWYGFDRYVIWSRMLGKAWNHPFDNWRTMPELSALLERHGFEVAGGRTICYVPGFLLTYFLPRILQAAVVQCIRRVERPASRLAAHAGYLLVVTAVKRA